MQATNNFDGYELAYIRSRADKNERMRQTDVIQGSSVCKQWTLVVQQGMERVIDSH
jgi:hypothetical protein